MKRNTRTVAFCGILAAVYAVITAATASFAFGPIQFRLADALTVLCCFEPSSVFGLTVGCFLANLFSTVSPLDLVIGTAATLLACLCMTRWRKPWQMLLPNILFNGLLVGAELAVVTAPPPLFWSALLTHGLTVALGETAVMLALGLPLWFYLDRSRVTDKLRLE